VNSCAFVATWLFTPIPYRGSATRLLTLPASPDIGSSNDFIGCSTSLLPPADPNSVPVEAGTRVLGKVIGVIRCQERKF
jgi:hypothetical protein